MARHDSEALVIAHLPLVAPIARRIRRGLPPSFELADMEQLGALGLLAAARDYDASRGVAFAWFARMKIRGAILDGIDDRAYREGTMGELPKAPVAARVASQESVAAEREGVSRLLAAVSALTPRQRAIIRLRYVEGESQAAAGAALGISQRGACDLEARALAALRRSAQSWG